MEYSSILGINKSGETDFYTFLSGNILRNIESEFVTSLIKRDIISSNTDFGSLRPLVKNVVLKKIYGSSDPTLIIEIVKSISPLKKRARPAGKAILESINKDLYPLINFIEFLKTHFGGIEIIDITLPNSFRMKYSYSIHTAVQHKISVKTSSTRINIYEDTLKTDFPKRKRRIGVNLIHALDANLAANLVEKALSKGIFILPIHDAFICD